jgi:hypothetical protein
MDLQKIFHLSDSYFVAVLTYGGRNFEMVKGKDDKTFVKVITCEQSYFY